ncbi:MAG TPA: hypothetical protein ENK49_11780 [Gammaproteobacteria bacterium]|nr:hypothetical protein [Gammaproteobacteria bacterium]
MPSPVVVIGIGEMGSVFARGFLRSGHPVYPVTRTVPVTEIFTQVPAPEMVLLAVAEQDLHTALDDIPAGWRDRLVLLQNELLPADWIRHGYDDPTVISVWFEKKKGRDSKVIIPSPAYGPHAGLLASALGSIDIPVQVVADHDTLLFELVRKNVYILTTNIAGLQTGGTVGELWSQHRDTARAIALEVIALQERLAGRTLNAEALIDAVVIAFEADPAHQCMGRSAPARLQRALQLADQFGLELPALRRVAAGLPTGNKTAASQ